MATIVFHVHSKFNNY